MRTYYGFLHRYGPQTGDSHGNDIGELHTFESPAARDAWIKSDLRCRTTYTARAARGWTDAYEHADDGSVYLTQRDRQTGNIYSELVEVADAE